MDNYNFSKIGKYISNKLHHIHKSRKEQPRSTLPPTSSAPQQERSDRSENKENKRRKVEWLEPTVGSYQVNYSAIDKYLSSHSETSITATFIAPLPTSLVKSTI